jgi:hypothetical protein
LTVLVAALLWATPVWASEQDTGYPWFGDITEDSKAVIQSSTIFHVAPVPPSEQDTGYPWFTDVEENQTMKRVKVFGVHPRTEKIDSGYPWHADIERDSKTNSQPSTTTQ